MIIVCTVFLLAAGLPDNVKSAACVGGDDYTWQEWIDDVIEWRQSVADWKHQIERNCNVSDGDLDWASLFTCPDYSRIGCLNDDAIRHRMDSLNCSITFCEDGHYQCNTVLRKIYREQSDMYKRLNAIYKDDLIQCQPRTCPEHTTETQPRTESVITTGTPIITTEDVGSATATELDQRTEPVTPSSSSTISFYTATASEDESTARHLVYADEFDGSSLNSDEWRIDVWPEAFNNELQYYTNRTQNIKVEDGHLTIKPIAENYGGKSYTSGRINSKFAWTYGRVDVRAKLPVGYGLWPAIWMLPRNSVYGEWPGSGEIDICEARGEYSDHIASTMHYGSVPCCDQHYFESSGDLRISGSIGEYHVYSLDWTPTALVYRLDGIPYYTQNLDRVLSSTYSGKGQPFDQHFHLILNVAVGGHYVNDPTPQTSWNYSEAEMWVDYVRVYELGDISELLCTPKADTDYSVVCSGVLWTCGGDNTLANVSSQCTSELLDCCLNTTKCSLSRVKELATNVFTSYDEQVNNTDACHFGGSAERQYVLVDGYAPLPQCLIKDDASANDICGAMGWACGPDNVYADVREECNSASDVTSCCSTDPNSCDQFRLRVGAGSVFQAYYDAIPSSSSCDFGGVVHLQGISQPLESQDGYGA